jgi:hypothetical protein
MQGLRIAAAAAIAAAMLAGCAKSELEKAEKSVNGFIEVHMPDNAKPDTVMIFAPPNCPREAGQRARDLSEQLTKLEIPNELTGRYGLRYTDNSEEFRAKLKRTAAIMQGEIPAVLINGMGRSNPTAEQVAAEYERTTRGK